MVAAAAASYKTYTPQHSVRTDASVFPDVAYMLRALFSHLPLPQSLKIMMAFGAGLRPVLLLRVRNRLLFFSLLHCMSRPQVCLFRTALRAKLRSPVSLLTGSPFLLSLLRSFFFFLCHVTSSPYHLSAGLFRSTFSLAVVAPEKEHYSSSFLILESKVHILVPRNLKNEASEAHPSRFDFGVCLMQGTPANAPSYRVYER